MLFEKFMSIAPWVDCIIFLINIQKGLKTTEEQKLLEKVIEISERFKTTIYFVFNKFDELKNYDNNDNNDKTTEGDIYSDDDDDDDDDDDNDDDDDEDDEDDMMESFLNAMRIIQSKLSQRLSIFCNERYIRKNSNLRIRFAKIISDFSQNYSQMSQYNAVTFSTHSMLLRELSQNKCDSITRPQIMDLAQRFLGTCMTKSSNMKIIKKKLCGALTEKDINHDGVNDFLQSINYFSAQTHEILNAQIKRILILIGDEDVSSKNIDFFIIILKKYDQILSEKNRKNMASISICFMNDCVSFAESNNLSYVDAFYELQKTTGSYLSFFYTLHSSSRDVITDILRNYLFQIFEKNGVFCTFGSILPNVSEFVIKQKKEIIDRCIREILNNNFDQIKYHKSLEQLDKLLIFIQENTKMDKLAISALTIIAARKFDNLDSRFRQVIEVFEAANMETKDCCDSIGFLIKLAVQNGMICATAKDVNYVAELCVNYEIYDDYIEVINDLVFSLLEIGNIESIKIWTGIQDIFERLKIQNKKLHLFYRNFSFLNWNFLAYNERGLMMKYGKEENKENMQSLNQFYKQVNK